MAGGHYDKSVYNELVEFMKRFDDMKKVHILRYLKKNTEETGNVRSKRKKERAVFRRKKGRNTKRKRSKDVLQDSERSRNIKTAKNESYGPHKKVFIGTPAIF